MKLAHSLEPVEFGVLLPLARIAAVGAEQLVEFFNVDRVLREEFVQTGFELVKGQRVFEVLRPGHRGRLNGLWLLHAYSWLDAN